MLDAPLLILIHLQMSSKDLTQVRQDEMPATLKTHHSHLRETRVPLLIIHNAVQTAKEISKIIPRPIPIVLFHR